jgi:hypothetical protein
MMTTDDAFQRHGVQLVCLRGALTETVFFSPQLKAEQEERLRVREAKLARLARGKKRAAGGEDDDDQGLREQLFVQVGGCAFVGVLFCDVFVSTLSSHDLPQRSVFMRIRYHHHHHHPRTEHHHHLILVAPAPLCHVPRACWTPCPLSCPKLKTSRHSLKLMFVTSHFPVSQGLLDACPRCGTELEADPDDREAHAEHLRGCTNPEEIGAYQKKQRMEKERKERAGQRQVGIWFLPPARVSY